MKEIIWHNKEQIDCNYLLNITNIRFSELVKMDISNSFDFKAIKVFDSPELVKVFVVTSVSVYIRSYVKKTGEENFEILSNLDLEWISGFM